MEGTVKIKELEINNFKNVEKGVLNLQNSSRNTNEFNSIIGIYGQNASGKTVVIEAFNILKLIASGSTIDSELLYLLKEENKNAIFKYTFIIDIRGIKYKVSYKFEIGYNEENNKALVYAEKIKYSQYNLDVRSNTKTIIDYRISYDNNNIIKPNFILNIFNKEEEANGSLVVAKALSKENSCSFIFNNYSVNTFKKVFGETNIYYEILSSIRNFAESNLIVVSSKYFKKYSNILPIDLGYGKIQLKIFDNNLISEYSYKILKDIIARINIVLETIIPSFKIGIESKSEAFIKECELGVKFELVSIQGNAKIPLRYESDGTKEIIFIVGLLISVYNDPKVCLAIDELDAGLFEFLFGEILVLLKKNGKGQLIFTANNLRALEVLDKNDFIFTTTNPKNKYIKLKGVKTTNNLRDFYLRNIILGGQDEELYNKTYEAYISEALRKVGIVNLN
ncbi:AAA family ATPase [uncultured Clostridium sp.]|uniref:AAA family ATPase n=1 Tax=uncultured Clostridium sp. TaxID=59620 RepID=UPI0025D686A6|nr:AAA family ATPase [uncultured Clostridium sp.]